MKKTLYEVKAVFYADDKSGQQVMTDLKDKFPYVFSKWDPKYWTITRNCVLFIASFFPWDTRYNKVAAFESMLCDLGYNIEYDKIELRYEFAYANRDDDDDTEHHFSGRRRILSIQPDDGSEWPTDSIKINDRRI